MVSVTGKVVEYWSGKPVSEATVMFNSAIATTDNEGNYRLDNLPTALYTMTIIHKDYERTVVSADLRIEQAYTADTIKIKPIFKAL